MIALVALAFLFIFAYQDNAKENKKEASSVTKEVNSVKGDINSKDKGMKMFEYIVKTEIKPSGNRPRRPLCAENRRVCV